MSGQSEADVAYPASWWESRTGEQLQDYVRAGIMGGEMFYGAQRELERRGRQSTRLVDETAREEVRKFEDLVNRAALVAAVICFLAAVIALISLTIR